MCSSSCFDSSSFRKGFQLHHKVIHSGFDSVSSSDELCKHRQLCKRPKPRDLLHLAFRYPEYTLLARVTLDTLPFERASSLFLFLHFITHICSKANTVTHELLVFFPVDRVHGVGDTPSVSYLCPIWLSLHTLTTAWIIYTHDGQSISSWW